MLGHTKDKDKSWWLLAVVVPVLVFFYGVIRGWRLIP